MWEEFVSLFYPRVCISCRNTLHAAEQEFCLTCKLHLPRTKYHEDPVNPLYRKLCNTSHVNFAAAFLKYQRKGTAQKILGELKYRGNREIGFILGEWYGQELAAYGFLGKFDALVPIPLHPQKLKRRGYNQSDMIAKGLAVPLQCEFNPHVLERVVFTKTQTKKHKIERWENTEQIFRLKPEAKIEGKHVVIVDDVITTGATIESAIEEIRKGNPAQVSVLGLATGQ